jgi:hypothetical protein
MSLIKEVYGLGILKIQMNLRLFFTHRKGQLAWSQLASWLRELLSNVII